MKDNALRKVAATLWHIQRVKRLVRNHLGSAPNHVVSVQETICLDPECAGPATDIKIITLGFQELRAMTIHKPLSEITDSDIAACV